MSIRVVVGKVPPISPFNIAILSFRDNETLTVLVEEEFIEKLDIKNTPCGNHKIGNSV
jgi:hypothetical protein